MAFIDETKNLLNFDEDLKNQTICHLSQPKGILIEGYRKICEFSNTKITLSCEDGKFLEILGEQLKIKEISHKEIAINGKINTLNFS